MACDAQYLYNYIQKPNHILKAKYIRGSRFYTRVSRLEVPEQALAWMGYPRFGVGYKDESVQFHVPSIRLEILL